MALTLILSYLRPCAAKHIVDFSCTVNFAMIWILKFYHNFPPFSINFPPAVGDCPRSLSPQGTVP